VIAQSNRVVGAQDPVGDGLDEAGLDRGELSAGSVAALIEVAAAAGGSRGRARVALKLDAAGVGDGCSPEAWVLLIAIARRLTRAGRIEVTGIWSELTEPARPGNPAAAVLQRARVQAQRLGLRPRCWMVCPEAGAVACEPAPVLRYGIRASMSHSATA
jgi:alanine racemase